MKDNGDSFRPCVVIPVYNNASTVGQVAGRCAGLGLAVIVVDDGSTDGSGETARSLAGVTVAALPRNRGKGAALREGLRAAGARGFTHAAACDADGQHDPDDLPALIEAARREPAAIIIGDRAMAEGGAPPLSRFGRAFSSFWLRVQTGARVADAQCGLRVYPIKAALALGTRCARYEMEHEILVRAALSGVPLRSVPVKVVYGKKVVSHFRKLRDNARFTALNAALTTLRWGGLSGLLASGERRRAAGWYHKRTLGNRWGYEFFKHLYGAAGRRGAYAWLRVIAAYYATASPPQVRKASELYLKRRFPGADRGTLLRHRREHIWQMSQTILDRLIVSLRGFDDFAMRSDGLEHIESAAAEGKGVVLLGAHIGNFEVGGFALADKGIRVRIVGVRKEMERVETYLRDRYRKGNLPMDTLTIEGEGSFSFLEVPRALERGEVLAMMGDRMWGGKSIPARLLGGEVLLPAGPLLMASLTGAAVVTWFVMKDDPRTYHFYAMPPFHVPRAGRGERDVLLAEAAARYARAIEEMLEKYPFQWYNFYDFWAEGGS